MKCSECGKHTFVLFEGGICSGCRVKPEESPSGSQNAPEELQTEKKTRGPYGKRRRSRYAESNKRKVRK